ncbi:helix-turn-helix transcriptional regulator [Gorillibacterium sp. sgz500922]|uniref:helix-turn-helix transcriptional regulator n=1 Tax=Gorillibacterium sp. sgz500922 TaxID=3446694 RepID=UPI003F6631F9
MIDREIVKGSTALLILSLLHREGRLYGYQISKLIQERSDNVLSYKDGTLYPALYKLEEDGLIQSEWTEVNGRKRKYYDITPNGRGELRSKEEEWKLFTKSMGSVLGHA